jgi:hypothetical protein
MKRTAALRSRIDSAAGLPRKDGRPVTPFTVINADEISKVPARRQFSRSKLSALSSESSIRMAVGSSLRQPRSGDQRTIDGDRRSSKSDRSRLYIPALADWSSARKSLDDPAARYLPENVRMPERSGNPLRCSISVRTPPGFHDFPETFGQRTRAIRTRSTALTTCTSSFPITCCLAIPVQSSNIRTWAEDSSAMFSHAAPESTTRA